MDPSSQRRPLKVRGLNIVNLVAQWLSQRSITPNQISIASVAFAALAALCLWLTSVAVEQAGWLFLLAGLLIQFRLLCNLFDGMVAVEGGQSTPSGELFNDIPDRFADALLFAAAGYACVNEPWGSLLGWTAATLSVTTAYVRTLVISVGAPVDFGGPMAKQHRMAVLTGACVFAAVTSIFGSAGWVIMAALCIVVVGCALTLYNRITRAYQSLEGSADA